MVTEHSDADETYEKLVEEGIEARRKGDETKWRHGDLALQVETRYGERRLQDYAERIDVEYSTLRNRRWVAKRFPENVRRLTLSWDHHQLVTARKDAAELLAKAEAEGLSVRQLALVMRPDRDGLAIKPPRSSEESAEIAIKLLEQVVSEARSSSDPPEERLELLEGRLYQYVEELNDLRRDNWLNHPNVLPAVRERERAVIEEARREFAEEVPDETDL